MLLDKPPSKAVLLPVVPAGRGPPGPPGAAADTLPPPAGGAPALPLGHASSSHGCSSIQLAKRLTAAAEADPSCADDVTK